MSRLLCCHFFDSDGVSVTIFVSPFMASFCVYDGFAIIIEEIFFSFLNLLYHCLFGFVKG